MIAEDSSSVPLGSYRDRSLESHPPTFISMGGPQGHGNSLMAAALSREKDRIVNQESM